MLNKAIQTPFKKPVKLVGSKKVPIRATRTRDGWIVNINGEKKKIRSFNELKHFSNFTFMDGVRFLDLR